MRGLLLLPVLLMLISPGQKQPVPQQDSPVLVIGFKWSRSRQAVENIEHAGTGSAATMLRPERNLERNAKLNDPPGVRDQRADTIDGRAEALEGIVQESRTPQSKPVDGFAYRAKIRNAGKEPIEIVFWEYQSIDQANPDKVTRRQFLCNVNIKPKKEKELQAFSLLGPSDAISVDALGKEIRKQIYPEGVH
jgi:hypothetical protein